MRRWLQGNKRRVRNPTRQLRAKHQSVLDHGRGGKSVVWAGVVFLYVGDDDCHNNAWIGHGVMMKDFGGDVRELYVDERDSLLHEQSWRVTGLER
jgi:hypothetical protein